MSRRFFGIFGPVEHRAKTLASLGPTASLSAVHTKADGTVVDLGVLAMSHPDSRLQRLWRTSRERRGLQVGKIPTPPEQS